MFIKGSRFHIDSESVRQYTGERVCSNVEVLEDTKGKWVLCYVEYLRANCLVWHKDLKFI